MKTRFQLGCFSTTVIMAVIGGALRMGAEAPETCLDRAPAIRDIAVIAARVYRPLASELPVGFRLRTVVDIPGSGLYAEFYEMIASSDSQPCATASGPHPHVLVAIRGGEFSKFLQDPTAFSADVRAAAGGGVLQWRDLQQPLLEEIDALPGCQVTLTGHSLGGMVAQLAAGHLIETRPDLCITAILFNSPGVADLAFNTEAHHHAARSGQLRILNLVHRADPLPRLDVFGGHLAGTRWYLFRSPSTNPHSLQHFVAYLEAHDGVLPLSMLPGELQAYLSPDAAVTLG